MSSGDWLSDSKTGVIAAWWGWTVAILIALFAAWEPTAQMLAVRDYQADEIQCRRQQEERAAKLYPAAETDDEQARKKAAAEREKEAREYCVQRRSAIAGERQGDIAKWAAGVSFLALLAAGAAAVAGFRTVREMRRSSETQMRAYVTMDVGIVALDAPTKDRVTAWIRLKNGGATPSYGTKTWLKFKIAEADDDPFAETQEYEGDGVIGPDGTFTISGDLPCDSDRQARIAKRELRFFVWGRCEYTDAFGNARYFDFKTRANGPVGTTLVDGERGNGWGIQPIPNGLTAN